MRHPGSAQRGFTLIELSIVLVIIGLIVGGVLAGQSLIAASQVRATITQVERYNTAVNTFYGKYGYLPGDIKDPDASSFGFAARGQYAGEGDGNGIIQGVDCNNTGCNNAHSSSAGEAVMFWVDLSAAHLIEDTFTVGSPSILPSSATTASTTPSIAAYLPAAKLGQGNYFYTWSAVAAGSDYLNQVNMNFFGLSAVSQIPSAGDLVSSPGLTVGQAYAIDNKVDDGVPKSGRVLAVYLSTGGGRLPAGGGTSGASTTSAATGSSMTCYDNGGVGGTTQKYSVEISSGSNVNCALSFQMQAGD
jgi:prepilin-type N-terminal cleavage/methylation domain-containing protein